MQVKEELIWRHKCGVAVCHKCLEECSHNDMFFRFSDYTAVEDSAAVSGEQCADCLRYWM